MLRGIVLDGMVFLNSNSIDFHTRLDSFQKPIRLNLIKTFGTYKRLFNLDIDSKKMLIPFRQLTKLTVVCCILGLLVKSGQVSAESAPVYQDTSHRTQDTSSQEIGLVPILRAVDSLSSLARNVKTVLQTDDQLSTDSLNQIKKILIKGKEKIKAYHDSVATGVHFQHSVMLSTNIISLHFKFDSLENQLNTRITNSHQNKQRHDANVIWEAPVKIGSGTLFYNAEQSIKNALKDSGIQINWGGLFLLLIFSAIFFYWIYNNRRKGGIVTSIPFMESCLFFVILFPLFNPNLPNIYYEISYFLLFIILFFRFRSYIKIGSLAWWYGTIILFVLICISNHLIIGNGFWVRTISILLNTTLVFFVVGTGKLLKRVGLHRSLIRCFFILYGILLFLAVVSNVLGKTTVSRLSSLAAILGIVHLSGLIVFIRILLESVNLWFSIRQKQARSLLSSVNKGRVLSVIKRTLLLFSIFLWVLICSVILNIKDAIGEFLTNILQFPLSMGSFSITLGNALYFVIVLTIANWLQKNLDILFSGTKGKRFDQQTPKNSTKITLLRLLIVIIGFLLGVTVLGISMDKLTIILGALSVGIGLGLQNIVNNFVSGVILIFEKPFDIGDFVELGDKKGRVQKIGIRSSTLLTQHGAEVIIPNGDLLSGRLVNWTLSTTYSKSEFSIKVEPAVTLDKIKQTMQSAILKNEFAVKNIPPVVLYSGFTNDVNEYTIQCWIVNIYQEGLFKSQLLQDIKSEFNENEIIGIT